MLAFRVMGTFEITIGERALTPTAPKLRTVMALLALHRNRVVSIDSLIEEIWPSDPPASALTTLQTYVYQLRKLFVAEAGTKDLLLTRPLGYTAAIPPANLDSCEFDRLLEAGRTALNRRRADEASRLLHEAVDLCKGPILADVQRGPLLESHAARLEETVLQALTLRIEAEIQMGRHAELIGELRSLVSEYPFYEDICAKLMIVLYRVNRRSAALQVYHDLRTQLRDEMGLDPSPTLQRLHQDVLADSPSLAWQPSHATSVTLAPEPAPAAPPAPEPPAPVVRMVPAELPATMPGFVGRGAELAQIDATLAAASDTVRIVLVTGMAGAGKTGLAIRAAHRARAHYPDGQLYAELRGRDDAPDDPGAILGDFLRALGVPVQEIPADADARAKLFRTWTADRRGMLVLDHAACIQQIQPLFPGGSGWAVVVTSRYNLGWLPAATRVEVRPLPIHEGVELLSGIIGPCRVGQEREAAFQLVSLCDRLPLTIRAIGQRLTEHPRWKLRELLRRLIDEPAWLAELLAADVDVRDIVEPSYRRLTDCDRKSFLLLGAAGRGAFTVDRAAMVLKADHTQAGELLDRLVSSSLIQREPTREGHYRIPRILRLFAWQRSRRQLRSV